MDLTVSIWDGPSFSTTSFRCGCADYDVITCRHNPVNSIEADNYVALVKELREKLDVHAEKKGIDIDHRYELTIAAVRHAFSHRRSPTDLCTRPINSHVVRKSMK